MDGMLLLIHWTFFFIIWICWNLGLILPLFQFMQHKFLHIFYKIAWQLLFFIYLFYYKGIWYHIFPLFLVHIASNSYSLYVWLGMSPQTFKLGPWMPYTKLLSLVWLFRKKKNDSSKLGIMCLKFTLSPNYWGVLIDFPKNTRLEIYTHIYLQLLNI